MRFGARLTRVSNFEERWLPTSHFFELGRLRASFHVRDLDDWLADAEARLKADQAASVVRAAVVLAQGQAAAEFAK